MNKRMSRAERITKVKGECPCGKPIYTVDANTCVACALATPYHELPVARGQRYSMIALAPERI